MAKQNVAEQFVDILARAGVKRLYGVVGDSLNPVVDAIRRNSAIDWIHVRHEETAAFAAGAEAQVTGSLAACAGSCGPGNLHLINGLYDAHRSMAPVLALASHIPSSEIGLGYFQETHPELLFQECSHYNEMISNPEQMPRLLQSAIQHAIGQGGVSVVTMPGDIASKAAPEKTVEHALVTSRPTVRPGDDEIDKLCRMVDEAKRVTLFCGSGTAGAHAEVMEFAEKVKSPVGHALRGKEWIQYDNPYDVGMSGLLGYGAAYEATHECDLLILLGTDFPYNAFLPDDVKIVQVDAARAPGPALQAGSRGVGRCARDPALSDAPGEAQERPQVPRPDAEEARRRAGGCRQGVHPQGRQAHPDPPRVRRLGAGRNGRRGRGVHRRHRDEQRVGGPLSDAQRQAAGDRFVQPRFDGQRAAAGDRRPVRGP